MCIKSSIIAVQYLNHVNYFIYIYVFFPLLNVFYTKTVKFSILVCDWDAFHILIWMWFASGSKTLA